MYEIWYDYVKPEYRGKAKLCYIDTDSFIVYMKAGDIYIDISKDVELDRPVSKGKAKACKKMNWMEQ